MKKIIGIIVFLLAWAEVRADVLTDITAGKFKAKAPEEMTPLADGERYAQLRGNDLFAYSYKTGQVTDTLFEYARAKGNKPAKIEGYVLSPSDRYVLVYGNSEKIYRRSFRADYYIYDRKRHEIRALSDTMPVMQPVFSPDGKYIAFARENNLYMHKVDFKTEVIVSGGSPATSGHADGILNGIPDWLYEEEFGTTCLYSFSPDSKQLAFVRLDESKVPSFNWIEYIDSAVKSLKYPCAGETISEASVVVYDTYYKSLKTMALPEQAESYIPRIMWRQGSRVKSQESRVESQGANIDEWQFLSDNSFICVNETDGYRHAYLYSAQGQKKKQLTSGKYDVTMVYGYDEKTQTLYYQAAGGSPASREPLPANGHAVCEPQNRYIYALDTKKNKLQAYSMEPGMHDAVFSPSFAYFVESYQSVSQPTTYTIRDRKGNAVRVLEDNKEVAERFREAGLPVKEFFSFVTPKGDTLNGWMLKPDEGQRSKVESQGSRVKSQEASVESRKYPVLMFHYSGPASQQVLNRWKISWEEYLAAKEGVICVCVDPRGTEARGRAFRNKTYMHIGTVEMEDQVYAARYLQTLPYVDAGRIGIWGWSFGGYATIMAMSYCGIHPEMGESPFKFGMAVAPVTDWRYYDAAYTERYMRRPQVNEGGYDDASAIGHADALQGNLLIVHGLADDNVHARNTLLYTEALVEKNRQFEMQVYPDDNHFLRKRNNQRHVYERLLKFLKDNL